MMRCTSLTTTPARGRTRMSAVLCLVAALVLSGCAVMDKEDCQRADWHGLGQRDGLMGSYRADERRQACAEHGMGIDLGAYDRGAYEGRRAFCTPASGRAHGDAGRSYSRGFCPADTEDGFLQGYLPALERFQFRQRVHEMQQRIDSRYRDLRYELGRKDVNRRAVDLIRYDIHRMEQQMRHEMMFMRPGY